MGLQETMTLHINRLMMSILQLSKLRLQSSSLEPLCNSFARQKQSCIRKPHLRCTDLGI